MTLAPTDIERLRQAENPDPEPEPRFSVRKLRERDVPVIYCTHEQYAQLKQAEADSVDHCGRFDEIGWAARAGSILGILPTTRAEAELYYSGRSKYTGARIVVRDEQGETTAAEGPQRGE